VTSLKFGPDGKITKLYLPNKGSLAEANLVRSNLAPNPTQQEEHRHKLQG